MTSHATLPDARCIPRLRRGWLGCAIALGAFAVTTAAAAQERPSPQRAATFQWDAGQRHLFVSFMYRDVIDAAIRRKLSRGLPTTIVLTGTLFVQNRSQPVSTTVKTCRVTWHVWNEAYRLDVTNPQGSGTHWTTTLEGVLRRCAEARRLLVATRHQLPEPAPVYLSVKIQVNPVNDEVLGKIKRWISRPLRTGTAAPGDALFSTFTGLFIQRIGEAERTLELSTVARMPTMIPERKEEK